MNFYTSDLHFYHENIIKYSQRPFNTVKEMNETLIKNWNKKVGKNDDVYILGDLSFTGPVQTNMLLDELNGRKYLIRGNHDKYLDNRIFDKSKFEWINDYKVIKDQGEVLILFHYPIVNWDRSHYGSIHLYGHIHNNEPNFELIGEAADKIMINVCTDVNDYEPKTLSELLWKYGEK